MTTMHEVRPSWYTRTDDTTWERVKGAFERDWRQTKHDFGGHQPNLRQNVGDTISQAVGSKSIPPDNMANPKDDDYDEAYNEDYETAYKYGYNAFRHHGAYCEWDAPETEALLRRDFGDNAEWDQHRRAVRRGWFYAKNQSCDCGDL